MACLLAFWWPAGCGHTPHVYTDERKLLFSERRMSKGSTLADGYTAI
jgi:hypothetical protein